MAIFMKQLSLWETAESVPETTTHTAMRVLSQDMCQMLAILMLCQFIPAEDLPQRRLQKLFTNLFKTYVLDKCSFFLPDIDNWPHSYYLGLPRMVST